MSVSEEIKSKLNMETGKLQWQELERHFARGNLIQVKTGIDLVDIAAAMAADQKDQLEKLLAAGQVKKPDMEQVKAWHKNKQFFWALVVAPWVLIQEINS